MAQIATLRDLFKWSIATAVVGLQVRLIACRRSRADHHTAISETGQICFLVQLADRTVRDRRLLQAQVMGEYDAKVRIRAESMLSQG